MIDVTIYKANGGTIVYPKAVGIEFSAIGFMVNLDGGEDFYEWDKDAVRVEVHRGW